MAVKGSLFPTQPAWPDGGSRGGGLGSQIADGVIEGGFAFDRTPVAALGRLQLVPFVSLEVDAQCLYRFFRNAVAPRLHRRERLA